MLPLPIHFIHRNIKKTTVIPTVKLKFRPSTVADRPGTIVYFITHRRIVRQITTGYKIYSYEWDEERNDIVMLSQVSPNRLDTIKSIREKITWEKKRLDKIIVVLENKGQVFSVDDIVQEYHTLSSDKTTVFEYIKIQIERLKNAGRERTSETYKQMFMSFMKFRNGEDLHFDMIDENLINRYESHMRAFNLCRNTTSFYMRILRCVYNRAVEDGLTAQNTPFKRVYTGVDKTSKRALSIKEIKKIKDLDLTNAPTLDFARDMFLFSFYMRGMSFIDIAYLKKKDLSNGFVVYNRRKTGQQMIVKWEKSMEEIANKHPNEYSTFLFPIIISPNITERKQYLNKMLLVNKYLKKIAKLAGISIPLTMYVARHSWASIAQSQNIPMKAISLGMGHDNEETTQIYLASIQTNIIDNANSKILNLLNKHK